jgi:hypothetical protein
VIGDIVDAARRLVQLGFTKLVFVSDHGHVLLSEIPAGNIVSEPPGEWKQSKRRCRLGEGLSEGEGAMLLDAEHMGIQGDVKQICLATGFKVFRAGEDYFHEGVSLPEAIVPVVVVHVQAPAGAQGTPEIKVTSKRDRFTSQVFSVTLNYTALFPEPLRVRVEAFDGNERVGTAADCDALDETTNELAVVPGEPTPVPILLNRDYHGDSVEVRVRDVDSDVVWTKLKLKNAILD